MRRLAQSTAYTVVFKVFLSSDHVSAATSKTVAITISKAGGAFGNPNAGASNATEISGGWYKFVLDTTDTGTLGDLVLVGTATACDTADIVMMVVSATTGGATNLDASVNAIKTKTDSLTFTGANKVDASVRDWVGDTIPARNVAGVPKVDLVDIAGADVSTTSAQIGVNAVNIGGTSQTGRDIGASVLLSSGTGTGQIDFTSGVVKANLAQILGTAITETAGLIAAAFKKFFNVATPTGTVNSIPDAVAGAAGGLFIAGSNAATAVNITGDITGNLSGSVGSVSGAVGSVTGITASDIGIIKAKTDNLPSDPADESLVIAATDAIMARIGAPVGTSISDDIATLPTAAEIVTAIDDDEIETGVTRIEAERLVLAEATGKGTGLNGPSATFYAPDGTTVRVTGDVDTGAGTRSNVLLTP